MNIRILIVDILSIFIGMVIFVDFGVFYELKCFFLVGFF